jgi:hypothetical protein
MKILFVYPEFPGTFWSVKHALKFIHKKAGAPPLRSGPQTTLIGRLAAAAAV